jgi:Raf kinase inhibitor-like YbhB/YbcL family protein
MKTQLGSALGLALLLIVLPHCKGEETAPAPAGKADFKLTSRVFAAGAAIPRRFTCDGKNVSPPLVWSGAPAAAKSFVLIVDDPDAPGGTFTHWILFNLPTGTQSLRAGMKPSRLPPGAAQGVNGFGNEGYGGPCPPKGEHHYVHHLYALDTELGHLEKPNRQQIDAALKGHVLGEATLVGTYRREGSAPTSAAGSRAAGSPRMT